MYHCRGVVVEDSNWYIGFLICLFVVDLLYSVVFDRVAGR